MPPIRVLVVDDSSSARELIIALLQEDAGIRVIGSAENGIEAVKMANTLQPDLITMDLFMPVMDGFEAIERIMATRPTPILVITSCQQSATAFSAIEQGALEVISKNDLLSAKAKRIVETVKVLSRVRTIPHIRGKHYRPCLDYRQEIPEQPGGLKVVAIAASTGGPKAIATILSALPGDFPAAIVMAQHIDADFVVDLQKWFNDITPLAVKIAGDDEALFAGQVYIAPGGFHLSVSLSGRIALTPRKPGELYVPSANLLLSAVAAFGQYRAVGVILSGMSDDGVAGMQAIKERGGKTIAQDEKTSVVFGMPREAIKSGCIDLILPAEDIAPALIKIFGRREAAADRVSL